MNQRLQKALDLSEEILENIELETERISSVLLKCLRLARLTDDVESVEWLTYEISGYKRASNGKIEHQSFEIGRKHGRVYNNEKYGEVMFTELLDELEAGIDANFKVANNVTTQGASVAGEYGNVAMVNLTNAATSTNKAIMDNIMIGKKRIGIIKGELYKYALNKNLELGFSKSAETIFDKYREKVDTALTNIISDSDEKLSAIYDRLSEDNKESWSQACDTCRKMFKSVAYNLFNKKHPDFSEDKIKIKSGEEIDISGDKYINRLTVCIDDESKLIKRHITETISWIKELNNSICDGVHNDITFENVEKVIIHTYICLGDILIK